MTEENDENSDTLPKSLRYDHLFKVVLLGDAKSGKTSLLRRFVDDAFAEDYLPTIGVDFKTKIVSGPSGKLIKLQIWDSAGKDKFASFSELFYSGALAAVYCFDLTSGSSFKHVEQWMQKVAKSPHTTYKDDMIRVVVGCKADLSDSRKISKEQGQELAIRHQARYVEVSAKNDNGIAEMFESLSKSMLSRHLGWQAAVPKPKSKKGSIRSAKLSMPARPKSMIAVSEFTRSRSMRSSFKFRHAKKAKNAKLVDELDLEIPVNPPAVSAPAADEEQKEKDKNSNVSKKKLFKTKSECVIA